MLASRRLAAAIAAATVAVAVAGGWTVRLPSGGGWIMSGFGQASYTAAAMPPITI